MPRLPTADTLDRPIPQASGGVAQIRPGAEYQATAQLGESISGIGEVFGRMDEQLTKSRRTAQLSDAISRATHELGLAEISYDRDQDFKTIPERFGKSAVEIRDRYEKSIDDPVVKQAFKAKYNDLASNKSLNVIVSAGKKEQDYNVASLDVGLDNAAVAASNAKNPTEQALILDSARVAIAGLRVGGWISEVDAVKREKALLGKVDMATVLRDMQADPSTTATKLSLAADYAPNLDPVVKERLTDQAYRHADTQRTALERQEEKWRKAKGDELLTEAFKRLDNGTLDRGFIEASKTFISPQEYKGLLEGLKGGAVKDNDAAYGQLQSLVYDNPEEAERLAFKLHAQKQITNSTLASTLSTARSLSRQEGPRSVYERSRQFVINSLDTGPFSTDPAPKARMGLAMREYDDFAASGKRTDAELQDKADAVVRRFSMIDMNDLAATSGLGARNDPQKVLDDIYSKAQSAKDDFDTGRITKEQFDKRMTELKKAKDAAEKALTNGK